MSTSCHPAGKSGQQTFFCDEDYQAYIDLLADACRMRDTEVWAWCLMPNHVHLVLVPSSEDGLRATISETHRRYTRRINLREGWRGHLWQERFHSFPMDEPYLLATVRYVELNPVKAKLVVDPRDWPWSSARARSGATVDKLLAPRRPPAATIRPRPMGHCHWSRWRRAGQTTTVWFEPRH
ncbi:transposase [Microbulbifer rhizosphaerae]